MNHNIHSKFPLGELNSGKIYCAPLYLLAKYRGNSSQKLRLTDLVYNDLSIIQTSDIRYRSANLLLPGLVLNTIGDPAHDYKYRVLDGRHRIKKAIILGLSELNFYVMELEDILKYYTHFDYND